MSVTHPMPMTAFAVEALRAAERSARDRQHSAILLEDAMVGVLAAGRHGVGPGALLTNGVTLEVAQQLATAEAPPGPQRHSDDELLAALGIDLEEVRHRVSESVGHGALELPDATIAPSEELTAAISLGLTAAARLGQGYFGTEHLVLGLLAHDEQAGTDLVVRLGASTSQIRAALMQGMAFVAFLFTAAGERSPWDDVDDARSKVAGLSGRRWDEGMRMAQDAARQVRAALQAAYDTPWPTVPDEVGVEWQRHLEAAAAGDPTSKSHQQRSFRLLQEEPAAVALAETFGRRARDAVRALEQGVNKLVSSGQETP